jgi:hypothetical protein
VVELAHAVAHPGAVVIHTQDALLANPAVVHSFLFDEVAFEAVPNAIKRINLVSN